MAYKPKICRHKTFSSDIYSYKAVKNNSYIYSYILIYAYIDLERPKVVWFNVTSGYYQGAMIIFFIKRHNLKKGWVGVTVKTVLLKAVIKLSLRAQILWTSNCLRSHKTCIINIMCFRWGSSVNLSSKNLTLKSTVWGY